MSSPPRGLTDQARADWVALAQATTAPDAFDAAAITGFPEPVRRWVTHAIAVGTPLLSSVELRMHGRIRLGAWRPFTAVQRLTPAGGFVWAATYLPGSTLVISPRRGGRRRRAGEIRPRRR